MIDLARRGKPFTAYDGHSVARSDGIELKFRHLHGNRRVIDLREESGGANCKNDPEFAPPDFEPSPQPEETEEVTPS